MKLIHLILGTMVLTISLITYVHGYVYPRTEGTKLENDFREYKAANEKNLKEIQSTTEENLREIRRDIKEILRLVK